MLEQAASYLGTDEAKRHLGWLLMLLVVAVPGTSLLLDARRRTRRGEPADRRALWVLAIVALQLPRIEPQDLAAGLRILLIGGLVGLVLGRIEHHRELFTR